MNLIKKIARDYFVFHKQERQSLISVSILTLALLLTLSLQIFFYYVSKPNENQLRFHLASIKSKQEEAKQKLNKYNSVLGRKNASRKWAVNQMNAADWEQLGLSPKQARATINQIHKVGKLTNLEMLKKIKYIPDFIINRYHSQFDFSAGPKLNNTSSRAVVSHSLKEKFDLNSINPKGLKMTCEMDSAEIKRFLVYRKRLGGFYSSQQVSEIAEIDSISKKILTDFGLADTTLIHKIKLNYVSIRDLSGHPYFSYNMATAIINYRYKHGPYASVYDLKKLVAMTPEHFIRMRPYLSTEP